MFLYILLCKPLCPKKPPILTRSHGTRKVFYGRGLYEPCKVGTRMRGALAPRIKSYLISIDTRSWNLVSMFCLNSSTHLLP